MMIIGGVIGTLFTVFGGFIEAFGIAPVIGPIAFLCVGGVMLGLGIFFTAKGQSWHSSFLGSNYRDFNVQNRRIIQKTETIQLNQKDQSKLYCPFCRAPLSSFPPCKCDYCGNLIK